MKIVLINPLVREWAEPNCFPLGLGYIATICLEEGHDVEVIDLNVERISDETLAERIKHLDPDFVGITGIITQYKEVKKISRIAAANRKMGCAIVCGGPIASTIEELLLTKTDIDICVDGEGEEIIIDLLTWWEQDCFLPPDSIKGISWIDSNDNIIYSEARKPLKEIPNIRPAYNLFNMDVYLNNPIAAENRNKWIDGKSNTDSKSFNIVGTRGCPYNCIYCYHNFMGQGYRKRLVSDIIREMDYLKETYNADYIHFTDDAFALDKNFVLEFCNEVKALNIKWSCAGRVNLVTDEIVSTMKDSGCVGLCYGFESGSQKILDRMNKKATIEQYKNAVALNKKYFDYEDYTFIIGCPDETGETIKESIQFCKEVGIVPTAVFFMTPYPGTPLFNEIVSEGFLDITDLDKYERYVSKLAEQGENAILNLSKNLTIEELYGWHDYFIKETQAWNKEKH